MKNLLLVGLCLCLCTAGYAAKDVYAEEASPLEEVECIAVILHNGGDTPVLENLLLIVVHKDSGKAMKATFHPELFSDESMTVGNAGAREKLLQLLAEKLQLPLAKYVCIGADALGSLDQGEAKEKGFGDLIGLGFSLLGSVETNLSIGETIGTFRRVFAQNEEGLELSFPGDEQNQSAENPYDQWDEIRAVFLKATETL